MLPRIAEFEYEIHQSIKTQSANDDVFGNRDTWNYYWIDSGSKSIARFFFIDHLYGRYQLVFGWIFWLDFSYSETTRGKRETKTQTQIAFQELLIHVWKNNF